MFKSLFAKRLARKLAFFSCFAAIGCGFAAVDIAPKPSFAQTSSGIVLFGNIKDQALSYYTDSGRSRSFDRYYLEIPAQDFQVDKVIVKVPQTWEGRVDADRIDLRINDKNIDLESSTWDKETGIVEVIPAEPVTPNKNMKLVLSNIKNPDFGGIFQFDASVSSVDDLPVIRYVGSWVIDLD